LGNGSVIGISNFTRLTTLSRFTLVPGEFLIMRPFDRFDGQIEEGVGKHQVQSLPQ